MNHHAGVRVGAAAVALIAVVLSAGPVVADTVIKETGTRGAWSLKDTHRRPGAKCAYSIYGDLYAISVRPPQVYGAYPMETWVGWRFKILRSTNEGSTWRTIYRSPLQKDRATDTMAADEFMRPTWDGPNEVDPPAHAWYKVKVITLFYAPGSATSVEGKIITEVDNYKEKYPTSRAFVNPEYCEGLYAGG